MRVVATTLNGRQHVIEVSNLLGHPDKPMQDRHFEENFSSLVEPVLGKTRCRAALDTWWRLDEGTGVSPAMQLLEIDRQRRIRDVKAPQCPGIVQLPKPCRVEVANTM